MIQKISISGFKSLVNFTLELRPGLNILVGPNGSGKTNIIAFFEFLGHLQEMSVSNAVSTAGGAGSVLTKIGENQYCHSLSATIIGCTQVSKKRFLHYEYSFCIAMFPNADRITYSQQRLKVKSRTVESSPNIKIREFDLDIERLSDQDLKTTLNIYNANKKVMKHRYGYYSERSKKTPPEQHIKSMINDVTDPDHSIATVLRFFFEEGYAIMQDLRGGPVFNIEPSKARIPEDSAKPPGIRKDGSGLYSTLYAMKQNDSGRSTKRHRYFFFRDDYTEVGETKLSDVLGYVRLANDSIKSIDVINNPFDNQLQVRVIVTGANDDAVLPLAAMSDGTIKWIALVTILFTNRTVFSIEEPENYLHPLMQSEILNVMRSTAKHDRSILMSTHSETLLNSAKPDELVVTSFVDGKTIARRPSNANDVRDEIQRTGFGLGYYYLAGSLDE